MIPPSQKKVGRAVTIYGQWKLIDRWLDNDALLQPWVEWIFINDKPSDPPPQRIREKLSRFGRLIEPPTNMGRCCARNLCVQKLSSEWIDIIDGDDIPYPIPEDFDHEADEAGLVFFDVVHHAESNEGVLVPQLDKGWTPPPLNQLIEAVAGHYDCRPVAVMWRRNMFVDLGGFDGRADHVEDMNLCIRARLAKIPFSKTKSIKASYQRSSSNRAAPPIVPVAKLWTWELARPLVKGGAFEAPLEHQIELYRKAIMWAGMREVEKCPMGLPQKLVESFKWLAGRHRPKN
jgi:glycosyltransferase involved in cell wall biosynthesis